MAKANTKAAKHTVSMLLDAYISISRQARPAIEKVVRVGQSSTMTTYEADGWEPGFRIEGSLVPRCPFCKNETRAILVIFTEGEGKGFLDRWAGKIQRGTLKHEDVVLECSHRDCRASVSLLDSLGGDYLGHRADGVDGEAVVSLLKARAGNTGELVHNNPPRYGWQRPCPFCGCRSWFSFITEDEKTQGMDVFECLRCLATITRYDLIGKVEWDQMQKRWKARKS